jgi:Bacterial signalling protein N terminal repeat
VGFGPESTRRLLLAGLITGIGVASMHYSGMAAMEMQARMSYNPAVLVLSVIIAVVASTAALWAALRLRGIWSTLGAALIMGVAVSGMHYTGMAAMHVSAAPAGTRMAMSGATAANFLLPLILGISILTFIVTATIALSPTDTEIRAEQELMRRISTARAAKAGDPAAPYLPAPAAPRPVTAISRAVQARRQAEAEADQRHRLITPACRAPWQRGALLRHRCRTARHRLSGRSPAITSGSSHQAGKVVLLSA